MRTVELVYFSWIRERVGMGEEELSLPENVQTIGNLLDWLKTRGSGFEVALEHPDVVRVALDQEHQDDRETLLGDVREIALFPPMTGG